jgi:hypothetical protein
MLGISGFHGAMGSIGFLLINCPKYITPRYTAAEVEEAVAPLRGRIAELERQPDAVLLRDMRRFMGEFERLVR